MGSFVLDLNCRVEKFKLFLQKLCYLVQSLVLGSFAYDMRCEDRFVGGKLPDVEVMHFLNNIQLYY